MSILVDCFYLRNGIKSSKYYRTYIYKNDFKVFICWNIKHWWELRETHRPCIFSMINVCGFLEIRKTFLKLLDFLYLLVGNNDLSSDSRAFDKEYFTLVGHGLFYQDCCERGFVKAFLPRITFSFYCFRSYSTSNFCLFLLSRSLAILYLVCS